MFSVFGSEKRQIICSEVRVIKMEVERANAFTMYYEPFELEGKRLYGTGYAVDHDTVPDGFYCYDVWIDETGEGEEHVFVSQYPLKENISGAVISDEPIDFHGENQMSMKGIQFLDDEPLASLKWLLEQTADGPVAAETAEFCMVQG
ncbi:hypothetical protein K150096H7_31130 [[Clostridium] symbiosum]